jgi:TPR repeat protein
VGLAYANGTGTARDDRLAVEWYRKAAAQGLAAAQTNLGTRYANGEGVARDTAQAVEWFQRAAEQGDAGGQFNLGVMYANGTGVGQDLTEAHKWLTLAAARSSGEERQEYTRARDIVANTMTPEQLARSEKQAREWTEAFQRGR